jgi:hypothetical protein
MYALSPSNRGLERKASSFLLPQSQHHLCSVHAPLAHHCLLTPITLLHSPMSHRPPQAVAARHQRPRVPFSPSSSALTRATHPRRLMPECRCQVHPPLWRPLWCQPSTTHLWPRLHLFEHHRTLGYLADLSIATDVRSSGLSPTLPYTLHACRRDVAVEVNPSSPNHLKWVPHPPDLP